MHPHLAELLLTTPILVRRELPQTLSRSVDHALSRGELRQVLPGVYSAASPGPVHWRIAALAACAYLDDAVVTGPAAAAFGFWPDCPVKQVEAAYPNSVRARGLVVWRRRSIPPEWVCQAGPVRITHPAWTAVDVCGSGNSAILDEALRAGVGLDNLWRAFHAMPGREANPVRRQLLIDSRDKPWSPAERLAHRILRSADVTGWRTNVSIGAYFVDIAWKEERVVLEIDGYEFHAGAAQFQADRLRDQTLTAQGWTVVRVTWQQLTTDPDGFLRRLRQILKRQRRRLAA
ncbi:MAG: endonuclease domain-containing protein [Brooklawnia sp.]|jgi:very-short-patch-repair endonuclease